MTKDEVSIVTERALEGANVQYHHFAGTCLVVCAITPKHGFTTYGTACCINYDDFDPEMAKEISFGKARAELWVHEGYRGVSERSK